MSCTPLMALRSRCNRGQSGRSAPPLTRARTHAGMEGVTMRALTAMMAIAAFGLALGVARAADAPDATIKLSGGSVAAGVGLSWGSGTLTYKGKTYPISVNGLSVGDVGVTKIEASGDVA